MKENTEDAFVAWCAERNCTWSMIQDPHESISLWVRGSTETEEVDIIIEGGTPAEARLKVLAAYDQIRGGANAR